MQTCSAWLPQSAILDGRLVSAFISKIERWIPKWVVGKPELDVLLTMSGTKRDAKKEMTVWQADGDCLILFVEQSSPNIIFGELMGSQVPKKKMNARDTTVVDSVLQDFFTDMYTAVSEFFNGGHERLELTKSQRPLPGKENMVFSLMWKSTMPAIHVLVPADIVIQARKRLSVSLTPWDSMPVTSRKSAIDQQPIDIGARVGRTSLSVGDLGELVVGDVIVLEETLETPLETTINGQPCRDLTCLLNLSEGATRLEMIGAKMERQDG